MRASTVLVLALFASACAARQPAPTAPTSSVIAPTSTSTSAATATSLTAIPAPVESAVSAADRDPKDTALDAGRHPAQTLAFFGIAPGMKVGEIVAGAGYTTELLARTVGPSGVVWAENPSFILERFAAKPWADRLARPINANVKRVDRELEAPFPAEARDLDAVIDVLFYHDTVWMKADRDKMNKAIFDALKHGGVYGIVDHSGRAGTGTTEAQTLHRIEEKTVIDEVTKAGFTLAGEADFLRNPQDARDWNASPRAAAERRGTSDRFVLKFVKP